MVKKKTANMLDRDFINELWWTTQDNSGQERNLPDYAGNNVMNSLIEQLETQSDELSCPRWAKLETQRNGLIKYTGDI